MDIVDMQVFSAGFEVKFENLCNDTNAETDCPTKCTCKHCLLSIINVNDGLYCKELDCLANYHKHCLSHAIDELTLKFQNGSIIVYKFFCYRNFVFF